MFLQRLFLTMLPCFPLPPAFRMPAQRVVMVAPDGGCLLLQGTPRRRAGVPLSDGADAQLPVGLRIAVESTVGKETRRSGVSACPGSLSSAWLAASKNSALTYECMSREGMGAP